MVFEFNQNYHGSFMKFSEEIGIIPVANAILYRDCCFS